MLRLLVLLLLLANAVYFVWSQGFLRAWNFAPAQQTEPQRVANQLNPESVRILRADEVARTDAAAVGASPPAPPAAPAPTPALAVATKPTECYQAGLFDDAQTALLRGRLESALPVGAWALEFIDEPARWIVYMGKYPNAAALASKRDELAALKLKIEPVNNPSLEFGLSLGGYDRQSAADAALAALTKRGVRTARVVLERPQVRGTRLKMSTVDDALKARFDEIRPALGGKALQLCAPTERSVSTTAKN